ncbi:hypothetical protein SIO17_00780 [Pseudoalteromonas piscicida]|uniref:Uncharacterized protein n=1 Tax=Pseudoalteromonas piscicida TaxID=43662 RepID=A0ABN5CB33_PSEO7|nr:hypothetical protein [Pseudoalteromonas piscicida]ATD05519.1 hypothetical protein PPIS_a0160 [Pseudoalteromonas piscicida]WPU32313.1 hypothetical protein SIO17_00780 [Pseudoalteromonas piscicida]
MRGHHIMTAAAQTPIAVITKPKLIITAIIHTGALALVWRFAQK